MMLIVRIAVKRLLRQHLSHDDELIDVHPLAERILSEGVRLSCGSTIKTDGEESDPWGLLSIIDIVANRVFSGRSGADGKTKPSFKPFLDYLISTLPSQSPIRSILDPSSSSTPAPHPAIIFSLRLLNLPLPLLPPLYKMLLSELEAEGIPRFTHFLLWGRGYRLEGTEPNMGLEMDTSGVPTLNRKIGNGKKAKRKNGPALADLDKGSFLYHTEEEYMDRVSVGL